MPSAELGLMDEGRKSKVLAMDRPEAHPGPPFMNFLCRTLDVIFFITLGQEQSLSKVCAHLSVCDHHPVSCCVILAESPLGLIFSLIKFLA